MTPILLGLLLTAAPADLSTQLVEKVTATATAADQAILSEVVEQNYRIGLAVSAPRTVWLRAADGSLDETPPAADATHFVGVVLREARTKRFLPASTVTVQWAVQDAPIALTELWGERFPVYGANVALPAGATGELTVTVGPPRAHRHGDMLALFTQPATVTFAVEVSAPGEVVVQNPTPPAPAAPDYRPGSDVAQAMGEARAVVREGPYVIGFIAEAPEPIWLWRQDTLNLEAVRTSDTNHLEIALFDAATGLAVPRADVTLTLTPEGGGEPLTVPLHMLLSEFYHYGATCAVPDGQYAVHATIRSPAVGATDAPRLAQGAEATFQWQKGAETLQAQGPLGEARALVAMVERGAQQYAAGARADAAATVADAFFALEMSEVDRLIAAQMPDTYRALEQRWIELRARMQRGVPNAEVQREARAVCDELMAAAEAVASEAERASAGTLWTNAFLIMLREGFEATLLIGLLGAALRRLGRREHMRVVWAGAGVAVAASVALAYAGTRLFRLSGPAREALEGLTMLLAVVVLFTVSYWLLSRVEAKHWTRFITHQIEGAITRGAGATLFGLAFLAVFREGAEIVLFYGALYAGAGDVPGVVQALSGGFAAACGVLVAVFLAFRVVGARIPIRPFFGVTGAFLYVLAFKFAGDGVHELQEAGWVGVTRLAALPDVPALQAWLGIYPTAETAVAQAVLVLALVAGAFWMFVSARRLAPAQPALSEV